MENIFSDRHKIDFLRHIQKSLLSLQFNSSQKQINKFFSQFPPNFLENKDNLLIICKFISMIPRRNHHLILLTVKLLQKILPYMKKYLQDESSEIWYIFRYILIFKYWMYEEGLISIEYVILSAMSEKSSIISEYFLPEIIENYPEIFHKEIKLKFKDAFSDEKKYSDESIQKWKEKRKNYFNWILNSYNYSDHMYQMIETNPFRLSIKKDDVQSFQKIISNSNLSINMTINENLIETFIFQNNDISLINYAILYNSVNIVKFLVMNDANLDQYTLSYVVANGNYDFIHLFESKMKNEFEENALICSVYYWHPKITHYIIDNYDKFNQVFVKQKQTFSEDEKSFIKSILNSIFETCNIMFFKSKVLPFLKHHPQYVHDNIYQIIRLSIIDESCFFCKEFLKFEGIDINFILEEKKETFLTVAVYEKNSNIVDYLLNNFPDVDVNTLKIDRFSPLQIASAVLTDMRIIKSLCNHPNININHFTRKHRVSAYRMTLMFGNIFASDFFVNNYRHVLKVSKINHTIIHCLKKNHLLSAKKFLKFVFENKSESEITHITTNIYNYISQTQQNSESLINDLSQILKELINH